nr:NmrA family transcriptional regulator [Jiangella sp. DSM 45060]
MLAGAEVVVDVSNSPSFEDEAVLRFFETSTRNLLAAEAQAQVGHHVALSIVGADALPDSGYLRAKVAQESLIEAGPIPYSIVRSTQFFEFVKSIADGATAGTEVRLPHVLFQPVAAADAAGVVGRTAVGDPGTGGSRSAGRSGSGSTTSPGTAWPPGTIPARWSPIRTPATSAPSWTSGRWSPAPARCSARPDSPTG